VTDRRARRLLLVVGLPGAGKTTLARRLAEEAGAVRMSPDEWMHALGVDLHDGEFRARLEGVLKEHARDLLRRGVPVVVEYGLWAESERETFRLLARELGVPVELHVLEAPVEELWRRVEARNADLPPGAARITRDAFVAYLPFWQSPTAAERSRYDNRD
jgi:predicted kinase